MTLALAELMDITVTTSSEEAAETAGTIQIWFAFLFTKFHRESKKTSPFHVSKTGRKNDEGIGDIGDNRSPFRFSFFESVPLSSFWNVPLPLTLPLTFPLPGFFQLC